MRHRLLLIPSMVALVAATACTVPTGRAASTNAVPNEGVIGGKAKYPAATVVGVVKAPAGVISAGGANVISAGGANVISAGGGNVISAGGGNLRQRRLLALDEAPLAVAEVFVADAAGKPIPGLKRARTDSKGRFAIQDVPAGFTFVIVARVVTALGDEASLKTLAKVTPLGTTVDVDTASTLVTTAAVQGRSDGLGEFNPATFQRAVDATAKHLRADQVPDLADTGAMLARMETLSASVAELKSAVGSLKSELAEVRQKLADLETLISQSVSPSPAATAAASPTASPTPTPIASVAQSAYVVSTLAGSGEKGYLDGPAGTAMFSNPRGLGLGGGGKVYVVETGNQRVRHLALDGTVSTHAGSGAQGWVDGARELAKFNSPSDVALDDLGNAYVCETGNRRIRKIAPGGAVSTFAGSGTLASVDGLGAAAAFMAPRSLDWAGGVLYVADSNANCIRKIAADGQVTTIAGTDGVAPATVEGPGDVAVDAQGMVYVTLSAKNQIVKIGLDGAITVVAGSGAVGASDGPAAAATFNGPRGIAVDRQGNLFVTDTNNCRIRMITPAGVVSTVAGNGESGSRDGSGEQAQFMAPHDIEVDAAGKLYVSDTAGQRVRLLSPR